MLPGDRGEPALAVLRGGGAQGREAAIRRRQTGGDPFQHPGAAEVQSIQVGQLGIGRVGHDLGLQPRSAARGGNAGQEFPSQAAYPAGGRIRRTRSASAMQGEKKSCPEGS